MANWVDQIVPRSGDSLVFGPGAERHATVNDLVGISLATITFSAPGFEIDGFVVRLSGGITLSADVVPFEDFFAREATISAPVEVLGDQTWSVFPDHTLAELSVSGAVVGSARVTKEGRGSLLFDGDSPAFTGQILVRRGKVEVNGVAPQSGVVFDSTGFSFLGGVGEVGSVTSLLGGEIFPGSGGLGGGAGGTLTINGDLVLTDSSVLNIALFLDDAGRPPTATNHNKNRLVVRGAVHLANAVMFHSGGFSPPLSDGIYTLIDNQGAAPISGTLRYRSATNDPQTPGAVVPLPEGGLYSNGTPTGKYQITYVGGDGNNLVTSHVPG